MLSFLRKLRPSRRVDRPLQQAFRLAGAAAEEPPAHYLSATAIVRNEARHIREWIEFHRLVGVERFTIYENGSTDDTRQLLAPYEGSGIVEVVPWPHFLRDYDTQALAYAHALAHAGPRTRWMAFLDIDEYLFPTEGGTLPEVLRDYEDLPALVVYWLMFGTSGHAAPVEGPLVEHYTMRAPVPTGAIKDPLLANYKSVVQPHRIVGNRGAHNFVTDVEGCNGYDEARRQIRRKAPRRVTVEHLRINHYYTKSHAEWQTRFGRTEGPGTVARDAFLRAAFETVERAPVEDRTVQRYLPALKAALGGAN